MAAMPGFFCAPCGCLCCAHAADGITKISMMAVADSNVRGFILISLTSPLTGRLEFGRPRLPGICKPSIFFCIGFGVCGVTHRASFVPSTGLSIVPSGVENIHHWLRALAKISAARSGRIRSNRTRVSKQSKLFLAALVLLSQGSVIATFE